MAEEKKKTDEEFDEEEKSLESIDKELEEKERKNGKE